MESLFASINPIVLKGEKLAQAVLRALGAAAALPTPSFTVWRSAYAGLKELFGKVNTAGEVSCLGPGMQGSIRVLLFTSDPGTEALRLLRADTIIALTKASPLMASELRSDVLALVENEKSAPVRDRLAPAAMAP